MVDSQGVKHRIERVGGSTKAECKLAEAKALAQYAQEPMDTTPPLMFHAFLDEWHRDYVCNHLSESTQYAYQAMINIIKKNLKDKPLGKITRLDLQQFVNSLKDKYRRRSMVVMMSVLHKSMQYAMHICQYITSNPSECLIMPNLTKATQVRGAIEDMDVVLNEAKDTPIYCPLQIMYHTGCRIGEALALKWSDVDMRNRTIYIHSTIRKGRKIQDNTKTAAGTRMISFSDKLYEYLLTVRAAQDSKRDTSHPCYKTY